MIAVLAILAILSPVPKDAANCHRDGTRYSAFSVSRSAPCLTAAERSRVLDIVKRSQPWQKGELAFSFAQVNGAGPATVVVYDSRNLPLDGRVPKQPAVHAMLPALNLPGWYFDPAHRAIVKDPSHLPR